MVRVKPPPTPVMVRVVAGVVFALGFAEGTWRLTATEDGAVQVEATDEPAQVTLSVNALGSLLLGGVAAATLRAAGLITADDASLRTLHALFTAERPPHLSLWY